MSLYVSGNTDAFESTPLNEFIDAHAQHFIAGGILTAATRAAGFIDNRQMAPAFILFTLGDYLNKHLRGILEDTFPAQYRKTKHN